MHQYTVLVFFFLAYPLQYSWASLVAQTVKNPPATREQTEFLGYGWLELVSF